jgi:hypothetical protein
MIPPPPNLYLISCRNTRDVFSGCSSSLQFLCVVFIITDKARAKGEYINRGVGVMRD